MFYVQTTCTYKHVDNDVKKPDYPGKVTVNLPTCPRTNFTKGIFESFKSSQYFIY